MVKLPKYVKSPLTERDSPLVATIASAGLLAAYRERYGYDATHTFGDTPEVGVYRCDTGFGFYYPLSLAGDESLYRRLQTFEWNYKEDKWEHDAALPYVHARDKVLDVGCGEGNFLAKAKKAGAEVFGMELNRNAAQIARSKGVEVHEELLQAHTKSDNYDLITSFQVLEHVTDPLGFTRECKRLLRPGGTLIIGVPNNDSFLRLDPNNVLNQPPHHMGLWNRRSLTALAAIVGFDVLAFEIEPLPLAETGWYQAVMENHYLSRWRRRLFHRLGFARIFGRYIRENAQSIAGPTIMALYRKSD